MQRPNNDGRISLAYESLAKANSQCLPDLKQLTIYADASKLLFSQEFSQKISALPRPEFICFKTQS